MKKIYLLGLFIFILCSSVFAVDAPDSGNIVSDKTWGTVGGTTIYNVVSATTVKSGVTLTVNGYLQDGSGSAKMIVESGSTLIVYGDLTLTNNNSKLYGNVIVTGSVRLKNADVLGSANLIALGDVKVDNGGTNVTGQVFPIPPATFDGSNTGTSSSSLEELIAEMGDGTPAGDLLADLIESIPEVIETIMESNPTANVATWDGSSNSNWSETANWEGNEIPSDYASVTINDVINCPVDDNDDGDNELKVGDLILSSDATLDAPGNLYIVGDLTINDGCQLNVGGNLTVLGALVVKNTVANPSSLIVSGSILASNDVTFEWSYTALHWFFVGHPIANPQMSVYRAIDDGTNQYALYDYADDGSLINRANTPIDFEFNQDLVSGEKIRGYQLKVLNSTTVSQTGIPNNQLSYSKSVVNGWQIIANPYPAYYKIPVASSDFEGTEKTIYVSDSDSNSGKQFYTFNTHTGIDVPEGSAGNITDGIIAPGQAFYIKGTDTNESIYMRKSNLVHEPDGQSIGLKSAPKESKENLLRLKLSNEHNLTDEAVIALFPDGDVSLNTQDSKQMMHSGTNYSYIYSIVNDTKAVINVLPEKLEDFQQVLGIQAKAGKQSLRINGIESLVDDYEIVLEDKLNGHLTTMTHSTIYEFDAVEGEDHERFVLHFNVTPKTEVPTAIHDVEKGKASIYIQDGSILKVASDWNTNEKSITVYTLSGTVVLADNYSGKMYSKALDVNKGVYIVKVSGGNNACQQKVFVK